MVLTKVSEKKIIEYKLQSKANKGNINYNRTLNFVAVLLNQNGKQFCSGVVISKHHVLSAAFCIKPYRDESRVKDVLIVVDEFFLNIIQMEYHYKYHSEPSIGSTYDIGVITVSHLKNF